jgi:hypothetical protein
LLRRSGCLPACSQELQRVHLLASYPVAVQGLLSVRRRTVCHRAGRSPAGCWDSCGRFLLRRINHFTLARLMPYFSASFRFGVPAWNACSSASTSWVERRSETCQGWHALFFLSRLLIAVRLIPYSSAIICFGISRSNCSTIARTSLSARRSATRQIRGSGCTDRALTRAGAPRASPSSSARSSSAARPRSSQRSGRLE